MNKSVFYMNKVYADYLLLCALSFSFAFSFIINYTAEFKQDFLSHITKENK